jgi:two-component system, sensor histidine kinase and response regulator
LSIGGSPAEPGERLPVDVAAALHHVGGDRALLGELVQVFRAERDWRLTTLRQAITTGDAATAQRLAHNLKGALGILGAEPGRALAGELEVLTRSARLAEAPPLVAQLEDEVTRVLAFFERGDLEPEPNGA